MMATSLNHQIEDRASVAAAAPRFGADSEFDRPASTLPEHLVRLPGGEWVLWRCAGLRGAGFRSSLVLRLTAPECAAQADRLIWAEAETAAAQAGAIAAVNQALDALRREGQWEDVEQREPLLKVLRLAKKGRVPESAQLPQSVEPAITRWRSASEEAAALLPLFQKSYASAIARTSDTIRELVQWDGVREAITWQNRRVVRSGIQSMVRNGSRNGSRGTKQRQHEELVANYLQRYAVKNDTIGFFGPMGWVDLVSHEQPFTVKPGTALLASRSVYFEQWCIDLIAEKLSENEALRPWIAPRLLPHFDVHGTTLYRPLNPPAQISPQVAAILKLCDGTKAAAKIAALLVDSPKFGFRAEAEVLDVLERLNDDGLILWNLECPVGPYSDRHLVQLLKRIGDAELRDEAIAIIEELAAAKENVAAAAGDPDKLNSALEDLEATFTELTGELPTQAAGEIYAGRTLVYEDCRRDLKLEVGAETLRDLGPPLSLVLTSARWFMGYAVQIYNQAFRELFSAISAETGSPCVDATLFWSRAQPLVLDEKRSLIKSIIPVLQRRWSEVLSITPGANRIHYSSDELRPRVQAAFDCPRSGTSLDRYHSPDVMIAAPSIDAIRAGDYEFVLGELHLGTNTLASWLFVEQHPCPSQLFEATDIDLPEPCLIPVPPNHWPGLTARTALALASPKDFAVTLSHDGSASNNSAVLPIGSLVVEDCEDGLRVRTRDGLHRFNIIELFSKSLALVACGCFRILPAAGHTPRVTIDRLIVNRESWCFPASELEYAFLKEETERFLAARRWAREHQVPRFVFVKSPVEPKPFYLDFDSPILVNIFTKTIRKTVNGGQQNQTITLGEMMPNLEQTWLPDAEGRHYTCEFRLVAVDRAD
jgi:hypothetical protein